MFQRLIRLSVVTEQFAPEPAEDARGRGADLARADDADGAAVHLETHEPVKREVAISHSVVGAMDLAVQREHQRDGMFGDTLGRIRRHTRHADAQLARRIQLDVVVTGRPRGHPAHARLLQRQQHCAIHAVVDKHARRLVPLCQPGGLRRQRPFKIRQLVSGLTLRVGGIQISTVVGLGRKDGDPHGVGVSCRTEWCWLLPGRLGAGPKGTPGV